MMTRRKRVPVTLNENIRTTKEYLYRDQYPIVQECDGAWAVKIGNALAFRGATPYIAGKRAMEAGY